MSRWADMVHWHAWEPRAINGVKVFAGGDRPEEFYSVVLWGCECGALKTSRLEGHWILEQVRGANNEGSR